MSTANAIIEKLGLQPHPEEGGYFLETYRSTEELPAESLPVRYVDNRVHSTCIYYLITPTSWSLLHRLQTDEIFHFYCGDAVELFRIFPEGEGESVVLGADVLGGEQPQVIVRRNEWQALRLVEGGEWALMGTTVAPGFEFADYETGDREELLRDYPHLREPILYFTR
jgi:predicted cupin superfamily sugar epimerase